MSQYPEGHEFIYPFALNQQQVEDFARISGDNNPIHLDSEYASQTVFKKPIVHGILSASIFSKYFGTIWPGEGTIYLRQTLDFVRPMFVDINYEAYIKISQIDEVKNTALLECKVIDKATGKTTLKGEATLLNKQTFF